MITNTPNPVTGDDGDDWALLDRTRVMPRRAVLGLLGGGTALALAGGGRRLAGAAGTALATEPTSASSVPGSCTPIPEETAGPYPGDGSNGPNVLAERDVVRSDITSSFGASTTVADGVPLTINLRLTDVSNGCTPLTGAAVYLWHCDREGRYSMYSQGVESENYLRGVQESDADGAITFQSIFPGAYSGRWPHIHFAVYSDLESALDSDEPLVTSQIALPEDICDVVFATDGYEQSVSNLASSSLDRDNVFADDSGASQLATVSGDIEAGIAIELAVGV
jgi:protocatechuate 3,4-dioxygenase beta subunit